MTDPVLTRLAALKTTSTPKLREQWRQLFDSEAPPFNRRYIESRLAYRIQELAYGGLKPETVRRLEKLGEELDGGRVKASRMKGIFMGGTPPYGYKPIDRKLVVDEEEAKNVRWFFSRFLEIGSATKLAQEAAKRGIRTPRGNPISKNFLYRMLNNRAYIGEAVHKGTGYAGEHQRLIDQKTWEGVRSILQESPRIRANNTRTETPAMLKGLLCGPDGAAFSPTHTRKGDRLYRYYVSQTVLKHGAGKCPVARVPAAEIEAAVIDQIRGMLRAPEVVMATWRAALPECGDLAEDKVREALAALDTLWEELFPAEQARILQLLIERVDVGTDGLKLRFRDKGLVQMVTEAGIMSGKGRKAAA
jgi:hypothetical protein